MGNGPTKLIPTSSQVIISTATEGAGRPTPAEGRAATPAIPDPAVVQTNDDVSPSEARAGEERRRASEGLTGADLPGKQAERDAAAFKTAKVVGRITTPKIVAKATDMISRLDTGKLDASVPLRPRDLGLVSIRPDTQAVVALAVKNGKTDFNGSKIDFKKGSGEQTDLDGPLWWDADRIYIDSGGQIRGDVPCFPNPDITEKILGKGNTRIPDDPAKFLELLARGSSPELTIHDGEKWANSIKNRVDEDPVDKHGPKGPGSSGANGASVTGDVPDVSSQLAEILDLANIGVAFTGTFKPGPLSLGDGTTVVLRPGAAVSASGSLSDMKIHIDAPVASMSMQADGTELSTGKAQVGIDIHLEDEGNGKRSFKVTINSLDAEELSFRTPAEDGEHQLTIRDVKIAGGQGIPPLVRAEQRADGARALTVNLPTVELDRMSGTFVVKGADDKPATVSIGGEAPNDRTMSMRGSLVYDSDSSVFAFDTRVENLVASVGTLDLVDSKGFDMTLASGSVSGSGRFAVLREGGKSRLEMTADPGTDWTVDAWIEDAQIGANAADTLIDIDVASQTNGQLRLRNLAFGAGSPPVFDGSAHFQVVLDHLRVPLSDTQAIELRPGTKGTLTIPNMAWAKGDRSPTIEAELRLEVGADAVIEPGEISGLKGARVEIDVETGRTTLVLKAALDKEGNLTADCGIKLRGVGIATALSRGDVAPAADVAIPVEPLGPVKPLVMATVRHPPLTNAPVAKTAQETLPELPTIHPLRLRPSALLGAFGDAPVEIVVPMDALDKVRVADVDKTRTLNLGLWDDKVGVAATLDISHTAGPLALTLVAKNGEVVPGETRIIADPPLVLDARWRAFDLGPDSFGTSERITIKSLVIKRDPKTGQGYLWPEVELDGLIGDAAELVGLDDWIKGKAGEAIAKRVFRSARFPLKMKELIPNVPILGDELIIKPELPRPKGDERPAVVGNVKNEPAPAPKTLTPFDQIQAAVHFDRAQINTGRCELQPTTIDLGDGQKITFTKGTELRVTGTPDDYIISGTAALGALELGSEDDMQVALGSGRAEIRIRVTANREGGQPRIQVAIDDLEADNLSVSGRVGEMRSSLSGISVGKGKKKGSIRFALGGGEPSKMKVELPNTIAHLETSGEIGALKYQGGANKLSADLTGDLSFVNGRLSGDLKYITVDGTGLSFAGPTSKNSASGSLHVEGAAKLTTDANGSFELSPIGTGPAGLKVSADITSENGSRIGIKTGTVTSFAFSPATSQVEMCGLDAVASYQEAIVRSGAADQHTVLDIRSARLRGDVRVGPGGFETLGEVTVDDFEGSLTHLRGINTENSKLDARQIDMTGSGVLRTLPGGGFAIRGSRRLIDGVEHSTLSIKAVADEMRFTISSPKLDVEMAPGAQMEAELDELRLASDSESVNGFSVALRHATFDGVLERGTVAVARPGSVMETLKLVKGTRLSTAMSAVEIATGSFATSGPSDLRIQATMRIEGAIDEVPGRVPIDIGVAGDRYEIAKLDLEGRFRMIIGIQFDDGAFSTKSRTLIDAAAQSTATGNVDFRRMMRRLQEGQP